MTAGLCQCTFYVIRARHPPHVVCKRGSLTQQRVYVPQCHFPPLCRECVRQAAKVDEVERSEKLVRKWLGDVLLKKRYFLDFGFATSREFCSRDVTREDLKIAIANIRERHKVKRPRACPGADINNPRDMSDVDLGRDELRVVE
jgi:hypothetical protein